MVEFIIVFKTVRLIPVALVYGYLLSGLDGNTAVGKKIGRICKNHVELEIELRQDFRTVALHKSKIVIMGFIIGIQHDYLILNSFRMAFIESQRPSPFG